jgi:hypothetical protein
VTATAWPTLQPTSAVGDDAPSQRTTAQTVTEIDPGLIVQTKELEKTIKRITAETTKDSEEPRKWSVTLRLVLGWLTGLTFQEASIVVGIKPEPLTQILHGTMNLQPSTHTRIDRVLRITLSMRALLDEQDLAGWFRGPVPALKNDSPLEAIRKRKLAQLEEVVASYFDTAYV